MSFTIRNDSIYRAIPLEDDVAVIEVSAENHEQAILVRFLGNTTPTEPSKRTEVANYVRDWFDLNTDLVPFYSMAETDPMLSQAVQSFYGLRNMGIPDLFEALCWGILGQQINLAYAYTLKGVSSRPSADASSVKARFTGCFQGLRTSRRCVLKILVDFG